MELTSPHSTIDYNEATKAPTGSVDDEAVTVLDDDSSFVEYVAPSSPTTKRPPPKYKAFGVISILVYLTLWVVELSKLVPWLQEKLRLSSRSTIFLQLCLVVFVLLYAGLDVVVFLLRIKLNGKWYGLGSWMGNTDRVRWVHEYTNVWVEMLAIFITVMEDGFGMFNTPAGGAPASPVSKPVEASSCPYECGDPYCPVTLKIEYRIQREKTDQYNDWRKDLMRAMNIPSRPGLLSVNHSSIVDDVTSTAGVEHPSVLQRVYLTFASIDHLNSYTTSPVRERLMRRLRPLLHTEANGIVQELRQRINPLGDLARLQSPSEAPPAAPVKWKVWWITVLSLYITVLFLNATTPWYLEHWEISSNVHERIESLITVVCTTFLSSYVTTPFLTLLFSHWMQDRPKEPTMREPWRTLEEGFSAVWMQFLLVVVFYGGALGTWWYNLQRV